MEHKFLIADPQKCNGCGVCQLVCSASKDKAFNSQLSRIKMVKIEPMVDTALACRLCENPPCVRCCTPEALKQEENSGVILVNEDKCNGCGWCIVACEYGVITYDPNRKTILICDLCEGDTICIDYCVQEALKPTTLNEIAEKIKESPLKVSNLG